MENAGEGSTSWAYACGFSVVVQWTHDGLPAVTEGLAQREGSVFPYVSSVAATAQEDSGKTYHLRSLDGRGYRPDRWLQYCAPAAASVKLVLEVPLRTRFADT